MKLWRIVVLLFIVFYLEPGCFAQEIKQEVSEVSYHIEPRGNMFVLTWELSSQPLSNEVEGTLISSTDGVGPTPIDPQRLQSITRNTDRSYEVHVPFGAGAILDPSRYVTAKFKVKVSFTTRETVVSPSFSINLGDVNAAINETKISAPKPIGLSIKNLTPLDNKIKLLVTTERGGYIRARAYQGSAFPADLNNVTRETSDWIKGSGELILGPLTPEQQYVIRLEELTTASQPVPGSERPYPSFGGSNIVTLRTIEKATVAIDGEPVPTTKGLKVDVRVQAASAMSYQVYEPDERTGDFTIVRVPRSKLSLPDNLRATAASTSGKITVPFSPDPDPKRVYKLVLFAERDEGPEYSGAPFPRTFRGYPGRISDSFKITITGTGLSISAETKDRVKLVANWKLLPEVGEPVDFSAAAEGISPNYPIPFGVLEQKKGAASPVLVISLKDEAHDLIQEARIQIALSPKSEDPKKGSEKTQKVQNNLGIAQQQDNKDGSKDASFNWKDIANTGIGLAIRYLVPLLGL